MTSTQMGPFPLLQFWKDKYNPPINNTPSLTGKTILITGANTGVGYEAAVKFAQLGATRLILGVRSLSKGEAAKTSIEERTGRKDCVEVWQLDMLSYDSIRAFAKRVEAEVERLDLAVLNAGIVAMKFRQSVYGWEETMQVNVLSTTLLALLLLPKLRASKTEESTPMLELVSSTNQYMVRGLASTPEGTDGPLATYNTAGPFDAQSQYSVSKLFLEYAHVELTKLGDSRSGGEPDVLVSSVCPGATQSSLGREGKAIWYIYIFLYLFTFIQRTTEQGARAYVTAFTMAKKAHGGFVRDDVVREDPPPMLQGEKGSKLQAQVWAEIVEALKKDAPEVDQLLKH